MRVRRRITCARSPSGIRTGSALYRQHKADRIVAEVNNGGDMVEATIRMVDSNVSYNKVHGSRGKVIRAEPVAALYEQGRIHHVGAFPTLEDQQCAFTTDFDRKARPPSRPPHHRLGHQQVAKWCRPTLSGGTRRAPISRQSCGRQRKPTSVS